MTNTKQPRFIFKCNFRQESKVCACKFYHTQLQKLKHTERNLHSRSYTKREMYNTIELKKGGRGIVEEFNTVIRITNNFQPVQIISQP